MAVGVAHREPPGLREAPHGHEYLSHGRPRSRRRTPALRPVPCGHGRRFHRDRPRADALARRPAPRFQFRPARGPYEIHVADAGGANQVALTALGPTAMGSPRWSPDGQTVVFDRYENGHSMIYTVSAEGGKPRRITDDAFQRYSSQLFPRRQMDLLQLEPHRPQRNLEDPVGAEATPNSSPTIPAASRSNRPMASCSTTRTARGCGALPAAGAIRSWCCPKPAFLLYAVAGTQHLLRRPESAEHLGVRTDTGRKFEYVRFPKEGVRLRRRHRLLPSRPTSAPSCTRRPTGRKAISCWWRISSNARLLIYWDS